MLEIIQSFFSDHNGIKLEIKSRNKAGKFTNMCKLDNTILTNGSKIKSQEILYNTSWKNENKSTHEKLLICSKIRAKLENYTCKWLPKKKKNPKCEEPWIQQPDLTI